jgi:long-chain acyl-CoA synthetase
MITGSAPIAPEVLTFFKIALGIYIYEVYGQTETSGPATLTHPLDFHTAGHVGGVIPSMRLRLKDLPDLGYLSTDNPPRGEVEYFGTNVFKGYFKNPEKTKEVFSEDGWLQSGDIGTILPNGSLKIIDRAKNLFKLSQGEYIAPEKLENIYA